jgi:hypothetical protein
MTTSKLFRQSDNKRVKELVKDLPAHVDRTYMLVHSDVFQKPIKESKIQLN